MSKVLAIKEILLNLIRKMKQNSSDKDGDNSEKNDIIEIADLVIFPNEHIVKKQGREIYLYPMDFNLLLYFVENKDMVLSKEQMADFLTDSNFRVADTIRVHVRRLREKIIRPILNISSR